MKLYEFLAFMKEDDIKFIKKYLVLESKLSYELFVEMLNYNDSSFKTKKEIIYRKIFKKVLTASAETSFRNKISQLYNEIVQIYCFKIQKDSNVPNISSVEKILTTFISNSAFNLFDKEWNYYHNLYLEEKNYYALSRLYHLNYSRTMKMQIKDQKDYNTAMEYSKMAYKYSVINSKESYINLKYFLLNSNILNKYYGVGDLLDEQFFISIEEDVEQNMVFYTQLANELLEVENPELKYIMVQKIKTVLDSERDKLTLKELKNLCQSIYNYSILLSHNNQVDLSLEILLYLKEQQLISFCSSKDYLFYFNLSTNLIKKRQWEEALYYYNLVLNTNEEDIIQGSTQILLRIPLLNILNKNLSSVFNILNEIMPKMIKEEDKMYGRIIYVIYYLETKNYESAYRECENIKRSAYYDLSNTADQTNVVNILFRISFLLYNTPPLQVKDKLNKLKTKLEKEPFYNNSTLLLMIWIKDFLHLTIL